MKYLFEVTNTKTGDFKAIEIDCNDVTSSVLSKLEASAIIIMAYGNVSHDEYTVKAI